MNSQGTFGKPVFAGKPSTFPSLNRSTCLATTKENGKVALLFRTHVLIAVKSSNTQWKRASDPLEHRIPSSKGKPEDEGSCQTCPKREFLSAKNGKV